MKRFLVILFLLLAANARAAVIFPINDLSGYIGNFPTNYNQSISNLNAAISAGGGDLSALSNGVINVGLAATNAGLGVTQVGLAATNAGLGVTQVGLAATNAAVDAALAITNFTGTGLTGSKVGRNLFLTNAASGGGGAYVYQGTNNIAPTNHANTFGLADIGETIGGGASHIVTNANYATVNGGQANTIAAGATYSTISGGSGSDIGANATYGFVGGGLNNDFDGIYGVIVGGKNNSMSGQQYSSLVGGYQNTIQSTYAFLGGGANNLIGNANMSVLCGGEQNRLASVSAYSFVGGGWGNGMTNQYAVIVGGYGNSVAGMFGAVGGGSDNSVGLSSSYSTVGGGSYNRILPSATYAAICGGGDNIIGDTGENVSYCFIGGGRYNWIKDGQAIYATIGGGFSNKIDGLNIDCWGSVIGGGNENQIKQRGYGATIGGGIYNVASNYYATIPGGANNLAAGTYGFAAGRRARSLHSGAFVMQGNVDADLDSTGTNQLILGFNGGVWVTAGSAAVRQPLYLGAYTNVNPTTIIPTMQMDWYYDAGSNYILRTTDGTTNGWAHLQ